MWIDLRGTQHRVCNPQPATRNPLPGNPGNPRNRDYVAFYAEADARQFIALAGQLGLATALTVTNEPDEDAATTIIASALAARAPMPGLVRPGFTPACHSRPRRAPRLTPGR
jgi:hypothetical protein